MSLRPIQQHHPLSEIFSFGYLFLSERSCPSKPGVVVSAAPRPAISLNRVQELDRQRGLGALHPQIGEYSLDESSLAGSSDDGPLRDGGLIRPLQSSHGAAEAVLNMVQDSNIGSSLGGSYPQLMVIGILGPARSAPSNDDASLTVEEPGYVGMPLGGANLLTLHGNYSPVGRARGRCNRRAGFRMSCIVPARAQSTATEE